MKCVKEPLRWRLQTSLFFAFTEKKYFFCLVGSYYWENFRFIQSINFLSPSLSLSLSLSLCLSLSLSLCNISVKPRGWQLCHNYKTWAANKSNLTKFPHRTVSFKYSLFPFCVGESNSLENSMRKAKSIKHFKLMLMLFFALFSQCFKYMTKKV